MSHRAEKVPPVSTIRTDRSDGLWPTVVVDEHDEALGPAYSSPRSVREAVETGRGVYEENSDIVAGSGDVLYFALVKSVAAGVRMDDIEKVLDRREGAVTRRPRMVKEEN